MNDWAGVVLVFFVCCMVLSSAVWTDHEKKARIEREVRRCAPGKPIYAVDGIVICVSPKEPK